MTSCCLQDISFGWGLQYCKLFSPYYVCLRNTQSIKSKVSLNVSINNLK